MKGGFIATRQGGTRPGMAAKVEGVLVTLRFVLVFEPVVTEITAVLLF